MTKAPKDFLIDDEFAKLFPRYSAQAFAGLEEDLLRDGLLTPLFLWQGTTNDGTEGNILIDGHNRWQIIQRHNLDYETAFIEDLVTRDEVKVWMIRTQIHRRNMTPEQLSYYRGMHYLADKRIVGNPNFSADRSGSLLVQVEPIALDGSTASRFAQEHNVSQSTIKRDAAVAAAINAIGAVSPEAKDMILNSEANISRKRLREFADADETEKKEAIQQIIDGTHQLRRSSEPSLNTLARRDDAPPWISDLLEVARELSRGVQDIVRVQDPIEFRSSIRKLIDLLEGLHDSVEV